MLPRHHTGQDPWLQLRRLRGRLPRLIRADAAADFSAAIEQGEAYHRAALSAGPAVSPTLLYYSLVQLGKAMHFAAGSSPASLPGMHGLAGDKVERVDDPPVTYPRKLRDARGDLPAGVEAPEQLPIDVRTYERAIRSFTGPDSSFSCMQRTLGEDEIKFNTTLGTILSGHPDCGDLFADLRDDRPIAIRQTPAENKYVHRLTAAGALVVQIIYGPEELEDHELADRFRRIPFPRGWEPIPEGGGIRAGHRSFIHHIQWKPKPARHADQPGIVDYSGSVNHFGAVQWLGAPDMDADEDGFIVVAPNAPTGKRWSRLTWWWVLLHALSDVARYHPAAWAEAIDLNRSPIAADLHETLARAGRLMPALGYRAIQQGEASQKLWPAEHALR